MIQVKLKILNMVKKQKIKQRLKNLMIKCFVLICFVFSNCKQKTEKKETNLINKTTLVNNINQDENRIRNIGFFDYDNIKDTLVYHLKKTNEGPLYLCNIYFGNGNKVKEFYISTGSGLIELKNCKRGCIEKSEITTGIYSSEEIEKYIYDEKLNNWFIYETITKQGKDSVFNNKFEELWSIDNEMTKPSLAQ